jgi:hypothetical protein
MNYHPSRSLLVLCLWHCTVHAQPACASGPTPRNDTYQNYYFENRCGFSVTYRYSIREDNGPVRQSYHSAAPCSRSSIQFKRTDEVRFLYVDYDDSKNTFCKEAK